MSIKIIQILVSTEDCKYQGAFLGLGDDGVVYVANGGGKWEVYQSLEFNIEEMVEDKFCLLSRNFDLTARCVTVLNNIGIDTEDQLLEADLSFGDLFTLPGLGRKSVEIVLECINNLKLRSK